MVPVMATSVTDLERLLRVTVVHSPLVPPKEAKNLHHGSSVLLPDSSLRPWRSTTFTPRGANYALPGSSPDFKIVRALRHPIKGASLARSLEPLGESTLDGPNQQLSGTK